MMISVDRLTAGYGKKVVLRDVSTQFPAGSVTAVIGANGCGKSTLFGVLAGHIAPMSGGVTIGGEDVFAIPIKRRAQMISYLAQSRELSKMTVGMLVAHGRFPYLGFPRRLTKEDWDRADAAMRRVGILNLAGENLAQISGGQRQKAYIAMMLCQDTDVMLLDEPTSSLDVAAKIRLLDCIRELRGKTVVTVLHDINDAVSLGGRICVMKDGGIFCNLPSDAPELAQAVSDAFGVCARMRDGYMQIELGAL